MEGNYDLIPVYDLVGHIKKGEETILKTFITFSGEPPRQHQILRALESGLYPIEEVHSVSIRERYIVRKQMKIWEEE